jgi:hypothetical protein
VNGDRVAFRFDDVTNRHTGICFTLGGDFVHYGVAVDTVIARSRIHDCGRLPPTNHDHGIYIEGARGAHIVDSFIYGNADWGVHLYPNAQRTYVGHDVIADNGGGVIVAGGPAGPGGGYASSGNVIEHNVIAGSTGPNVESWWEGNTGTANVVRRNCLWPKGADAVDDNGGMSLTGNIQAAPAFIDPAVGDFRLKRAGRCAAFGAGRRR